MPTHVTPISAAPLQRDRVDARMPVRIFLMMGKRGVVVSWIGLVWLLVAKYKGIPM